MNEKILATALNLNITQMIKLLKSQEKHNITFSITMKLDGSTKIWHDRSKKAVTVSFACAFDFNFINASLVVDSVCLKEKVHIYVIW